MPSTAYSHWSRYWAGGCLTSLPQDFVANYDGEVAAFWRGCFKALPRSAAVLDVCTGNGALALLAAAFSHQQASAFAITAVDAARVDTQAVCQAHPDAARHMEAIRFFDRTPFETADLQPESFDLVMSQFGIEYCDWQAAAARCEQLLRPGGRLVFVAHTPTSDMLETMRRESGDFAFLDELQVLDVLDRFASGEFNAPRLRRELNRIGPELFARQKRSASALFRYVLTMADQTLDLTNAALERQREAIGTVAADMAAAKQRLADMLSVNESISHHPDWTRAFEDAGLAELEHGQLHYRGSHRIGTFHRFEKPCQT